MIELLDRIKRAYSRHLWVFLLCVCLFFGLLLLFLLWRRENEPPALDFPLISIETPQLLVTEEQMSRLSYTDSVLGELHWELSQDSLLELNRVLGEYGIREPEEISQFLAQATVETGAGLRLTEVGSEEYFQSRGYTTGTRGAGYLHLTHDYGQMAFSTWMMKRYVPELKDIDYKNPSGCGKDEIALAYQKALQLAANLGLDISRYSRIVYDPASPVTTGADYIAQTFAWESAGYYWMMAGIGDALSSEPGVDNVDIASERVGGGNWQSRREAYLAFYPVLTAD